MNNVSIRAKQKNTEESVNFVSHVSQNRVPQRALAEICNAIANINGWGSVEIYIQNFKITQITERNIKKTDTSIYNVD